MMVVLAYLATKTCSYEDAEKLILDLQNIKISDDTIRKVTNFVGKIVYESDISKTVKILEEIKNGKEKRTFDVEGCLYAETDGSFVNVIEKGKEKPVWRENKIGITFNSGDILRFTDKEGNLVKKVNNIKYISYIDNAENFKQHFFAHLIKEGYGKFKKTILISDGAPWIKNFKTEYISDALHILDFWHLCENASNFAKKIFSYNEVLANEKFIMWRDLLKNSEYEKVLKDIEKYKDLKFADGTVNLYVYILNNIESIDYKTYEKNDYFIGSGAVESGNKYLVQRRLKLSGMKWLLENARFMSSLRAKLCSGLWGEVVELVYNFLNK